VHNCRKNLNAAICVHRAVQCSGAAQFRLRCRAVHKFSAAALQNNKAQCIALHSRLARSRAVQRFAVQRSSYFFSHTTVSAQYQPYQPYFQPYFLSHTFDFSAMLFAALHSHHSQICSHSFPRQCSSVP
jgi:hypothetical protein